MSALVMLLAGFDIIYQARNDPATILPVADLVSNSAWLGGIGFLHSLLAAAGETKFIMLAPIFITGSWNFLLIIF